MKKFFFVISVLITYQALIAQPQPESSRPKVVVGIVVDQMRQEYLYRYYAKFGEGGFKRLVNGGFMLQNAHYNYVPTVTGAGHASIYAGTTPAIHGVVGNDWYDKNLKKNVYCVDDDRYATVGSTSVPDGKMSPHRMLTTTITDELKLNTINRSKVVSLSIKDRGAILPAGHLADAAYWYDEKTGRFITSTFYMTKLPQWVEKFNQLNLPDKYLSGVWNPIRPLSDYIESGPDDSPYEMKFVGKEKSVFPYNLRELRKQNGNYDLLSYTPFSNDYLTEMAKTAIDNEYLGKDEWTDFLCVSYSATDKFGHSVGPYAVELEDMYIRLDKNLEDLFKKLDQTAGEGNYVVFLTADHGVAENPQFMIDQRAPAGYLIMENLKVRLNEYLAQYFPNKILVENIINEQIYFNHEVFNADPKTGGVDLLIATELTVNFLLQEKGVANVFSKNLIRQGNFGEDGYKGMVIRGYYPKRSGDIFFILEPGWYESGRIQGTTHGSSYTYDTHVPVLFYGKGIKKGSTSQYHSITDIAPTLAVVLKIKFPNGCTGHPIAEMID